ncbi:hypothetical protein H2248_006172 [Termitomyces sp. 'cryptogamus']|nr:hypothetical protein H2248_006172 [Termitomyces sp. 'cryptogamus']
MQMGFQQVESWILRKDFRPCRLQIDSRVLIYILQIGGGGTYAAIGARIWLSAEEIGMIIDKGYDFPTSIETKLSIYGPDMWIFRDQPNRLTTHALNSYRGEHRK